MKRRSDKPKDRDATLEQIMGLGEKSMRKSYYPELQKRIKELEKRNEQLLELIRQQEYTERELAESKEMLSDIIDHQPVGIFRFRVPAKEDLNQGLNIRIKIDFISKKFAEMFALKSTDPNQDIKPVFMKVHPDDKERFLQLNDASIRNFTPFFFEGQMKTGKKYSWLNVYSFPRVLKNGDRVWTGVVMDITEKAQRKKLQQEVVLAKKTVEIKQNFLANMSHEIRTPLTGIEGMAHILAQTPMSDQQKDYLETILISTQNLRMIINQVLDYSKIEAGKMPVQQICFPTQELVDRLRHLLVSLCGQSIPFVLEVSPHLPEQIESDLPKIMQIATNFISNAVKYGNGSPVVVRFFPVADHRKRSSQFRVEVTDHGPGIQMQKQKDIFTPFAQLEQNDMRPVEGTGLGLYISKELAALLRGKVGVKSRLNKGSTFWFTFHSLVATARISNQPEVVETMPSPQNLNVLLVEDKQVNQKVISLMLKKLGHSVVVANNGEQALKTFKPGIFDVIFMDIQMPVMDGLTATVNLRKEFSALPPVIGLSANAFEGDKEKYMSKGLDDYLTKPVALEELSQMLSKWCCH